MKARDLHPGHVLIEHDWHLHITRVEPDVMGVAVVTSELGFPLHLRLEEPVEVEPEGPALPGVVVTPPVTALGGAL